MSRKQETSVVGSSSRPVPQPEPPWPEPPTPGPGRFGVAQLSSCSGGLEGRADVLTPRKSDNPEEGALVYVSKGLTMLEAYPEDASMVQLLRWSNLARESLVIWSR